jgi:hypothetical protein
MQLGVHMDEWQYVLFGDTGCSLKKVFFAVIITDALSRAKEFLT